MKTILTGLAVAIGLCLSAPTTAATIESIEARIGLGLTPDLQGFPAFFANGFVQGSTSHTDTITFSDGLVEVDYDLTIAAFDAAGAPAGLIVNNQATGVELGVNNSQIDAGESIVVTYNAITPIVIGVPPFPLMVDLGSIEHTLSSIAFAAFTSGTDTYTYSGVGAGVATGDDTSTLTFVPPTEVTGGDSFTITADSGAFRALFISQATSYELLPDPNLVPEPASVGLAALGLAAAAATRFRK
ncbi:MAG: PEP-CTERM sorting domain-containing protein [Planctomycetota bacterium]